MSQTEIAGCRLALAGETPAKGLQFPDLECTTVVGRRIRLSDYRGRSNLVLVFTDDRKTSAELLSQIAGSNDQFRSHEVEVIAVTQYPENECARIEEELRLPFAVLPDEDGRIHRKAGAGDPQGRSAPVVYVTDRYGEVFAAWRARDDQTLPDVAEILSWLEFIDIQCPECEPPEWPA